MDAIDYNQSRDDADCGDLSWMCCIPVEKWAEFAARTYTLTEQQRVNLHRRICACSARGGTTPGGGGQLPPTPSPGGIISKEECLKKLRASMCEKNGFSALKALYYVLGGSLGSGLPTIPVPGLSALIAWKEIVGTIIAACEQGRTVTDEELVKFCTGWRDARSALPNMTGGQLLLNQLENTELFAAAKACCVDLSPKPPTLGGQSGQYPSLPFPLPSLPQLGGASFPSMPGGEGPGHTVPADGPFPPGVYDAFAPNAPPTQTRQPREVDSGLFGTGVSGSQAGAAIGGAAYGPAGAAAGYVVGGFIDSIF